MATTEIRNSSREFQEAILAMSQGRTRLPNTTITATKIAASTAATPSSESPAPMLPISGKRIMRGTTARSCATSMPTMTRLERVPITPCSESDLRTTAVLESESNAPNHAASCHPKPSIRVVRGARSEEHTSELQSRQYLVCRLLLEKKNKRDPRLHL